MKITKLANGKTILTGPKKDVQQILAERKNSLDRSVKLDSLINQFEQSASSILVWLNTVSKQDFEDEWRVRRRLELALYELDQNLRAKKNIYLKR